MRPCPRLLLGSTFAFSFSLSLPLPSLPPLPCLAFAFASLPSHPAICPDFSPSPPPNQTTQTNTNVTASYGSKIPPHVLSDRLASYVHYFTLHGALRPFGASALGSLIVPRAAALRFPEKRLVHRRLVTHATV